MAKQVRIIMADTIAQRLIRQTWSKGNATLVHYNGFDLDFRTFHTNILQDMQISNSCQNVLNSKYFQTANWAFVGDLAPLSKH